MLNFYLVFFLVQYFQGQGADASRGKERGRGIGRGRAKDRYADTGAVGIQQPLSDEPSREEASSGFRGRGGPRRQHGAHSSGIPPDYSSQGNFWKVVLCLPVVYCVLPILVFVYISVEVVKYHFFPSFIQLTHCKRNNFNIKSLTKYVLLSHGFKQYL